MAASGAKVLQLRSVEFARNHGVQAARPLDASATADGTWIREEDERMLEKAMISGVTHTLEETVYRVEGVDAGAALRARSPTRGVNVDTIVQTGAARSSSRAPADDRDAASRARSTALGVDVARARRPRQGQRDRRRA